MRTYLAGQGLKRLLGIVLVLFLLGSMAPAAIAVAQDDGEEPSCPDGLVYDADEDICLLPEDVPSEGDSADEADDSADADDSFTEEDLSGDDASDSVDGDDSEGDAVPTTVTNVVLHAYSCPDGWDVDTKGLDASYDPCSTQPDSEGTIQATGPEGVTFDLSAVGDLDAASTGTALLAGTWTVNQTTGGPSWANCLVFDHEGNQIDQVTGPVEGTSLSFDLVVGDWLECEWFINGAGPGNMTSGEPAGDVTFTAGRCPYGYELTVDRQLLMSECTLKGGGGTITVSVDGEKVAEGEIPADDPVVTLTPVTEGPYPSGEWTVKLQRSDDTSGGIVQCDVTHTDGSPASIADSGTSDTLTFPVASGEDVACVAYVFENFARAGTARGLTIVGHLCPEGTLRADATLDTCSLLFDGGNAYIEFDLYGPDDTLAAQSGLAPDTRQWTFAEVDRAGTWRLVFRPLIIDTPPVVTCTGETTDGQLQPLEKTSPTDGQPGIDIAVGVGHKVTCDLLLFTEVPADADESADNTTSQNPVNTDNLQGVVGNPPAATGTRINIRTYNCDAGTVATDDLSAKCRTPAVGVNFTVSSATESLGSGSTNEDGNVEFWDVPDGRWQFIQTVPSGYGEPVVFCNGYFLTWLTVRNSETREEEVDVEWGNQIWLQLFSEEITSSDEPFVDCTWFNVPALGPDNGPNIYGDVQVCLNNELSGNPSFTVANDRCLGLIWDVTFRVKDGSQTIAESISNHDGEAEFIKLPFSSSGTYSIEVDLPANRVDIVKTGAKIFCDAGTLDGNYILIEPESPGSLSVNQALAPGEAMRCTWFFSYDTSGASNEEVLDVGLYFFVRQCPSSTALNANKSETCVLPTESPQYTMIIDGQRWFGGDFLGERGVSIQQANATDQPVEYITGESVISIAPIPGMGDPFYECNIRRASGAEGFETGRLDRNNVVLTYTWNLDDLIVCTIYYWPEVAADPGTGDKQVPSGQQGIVANPGEEGDAAIASATDPNNLTIQFWTCPDGVDPADDQANLLLSCAMDQAARAVTVTTDAGAQDASVTGSASWPFTDSQVSVTQPGGIAASSAWCSSAWTDNGEDAGEFPDAVLLDGGMLSLTVAHPATTIYCDWFLFGAEANGAPSQVPVLASIAGHTTYFRRWSD